MIKKKIVNGIIIHTLEPLHINNLINTNSYINKNQYIGLNNIFNYKSIPINFNKPIIKPIIKIKEKIDPIQFNIVILENPNALEPNKTTKKEMPIINNYTIELLNNKKEFITLNINPYNLNIINNDSIEPMPTITFFNPNPIIYNTPFINNSEIDPFNLYLINTPNSLYNYSLEKFNMPNITNYNPELLTIPDITYNYESIILNAPKKANNNMHDLFTISHYKKIKSELTNLYLKTINHIDLTSFKTNLNISITKKTNNMYIYPVIKKINNLYKLSLPNNEFTYDNIKMPNYSSYPKYRTTIKNEMITNEIMINELSDINNVSLYKSSVIQKYLIDFIYNNNYNTFNITNYLLSTYIENTINFTLLDNLESKIIIPIIEKPKKIKFYPLIYINRCISVENYNKNINTYIPNNIIQIIDSSDTLLDIEKENIDQINTTQTTFNYYLYDFSMSRLFILSNFDNDVLYAYENIIDIENKILLIKYFLLYVNGGIFINRQYKLINNNILNTLLDKEYFVKINYKNISEDFMICLPNNEILMNCINYIIYNVKNNLKFNNNIISKYFPISEIINLDMFYKKNYIKMNGVNIVQLNV